MHWFWIVIAEFIQIAGYGTFEFWSRFVQRSETGLKCHRIAAQVSIHRWFVFSLLESPEVVLDQESGVELADRHLIVDTGRWNDLIQQLWACSLPNLLDGRSKFSVRVVNVPVSFDFQARPHDSEQRCVEQNCAVTVEWHVHRHEPFTSNAMRTKLAETERRRYFSQQRHDVKMLDATFGVGVVLAPQPNEFVKMMRAKDGPITSEIIEIIHDDSHEQVDDLGMERCWIRTNRKETSDLPKKNKERRTRWNRERPCSIRTPAQSYLCLDRTHRTPHHILRIRGLNSPAWCPAKLRQSPSGIAPEPLVGRSGSCCYDWLRRRLHCRAQFFRKPEKNEFSIELLLFDSLRKCRKLEKNANCLIANNLTLRYPRHW